MTDFNRIFIDTNPFIYLLDSKNEYTEKMEFIMDKLTENDCVLYSSPITVAEYMVHPYKENCPEKIKHFLCLILNILMESIHFYNYLYFHNLY